MLPKPPGCVGCPFYGNGHGFVPDEIRPGSRVMIVGQNPGAEEEASGVPFCGKTGQFMESKFLPLAGLDRTQTSIGNAIRCRVSNSNMLPEIDDARSREAVGHCTRAHLRIPEGTRLVVAQGAYALYALTGEGWNAHRRISDWRGWLLPLTPANPTRHLAAGIYHPGATETAVFATYHLAALFKAPELQHPAKHDWARLGRFLSGTWPEQLPPLRFEPPDVWPALAAFDTEYVIETGKLIRYSLAWRDRDGQPIVHVVDGETPNPVPFFGRENTVIMHNTGADIGYLEQIIGAGTFRVEDTMHAHAVLWSDLDHDLGFGGSIYGRINKWKHLAHLSPLIYSGGDALVTYDFWRGLLPEFERDPRSRWVYDNLQMPLLPIIRRATDVGLRVNQDRARRALDELEAVCQDAAAQAQAAVGWPINLGSAPQVQRQLYDVEAVHTTAKRMFRRPVPLAEVA